LSAFDVNEDQFDTSTRRNTIYRSFDRYGEIVVFDGRRGRVLTFGGICEQSCVDLRDPAHLVFEYTQAMLLPLLAIKPTRVTLLGLGGGALAHGLLHILPDARLDIVELRQSVIDVAYTHFFLPKIARIKMHCLDAGIYVNNAPAASADLLLCDLYDDYEASALQLDIEFYRQCRRILTNDGWLAINFHTLPTIEHPVIQTLCAEFSAIYLCIVNSGNWIIVASNADIACDDNWQHMQQPEGLLRRQLAIHSHRLIRIASTGGSMGGVKPRPDSK
jgi:spermidine synthase